MNNKGIVISGGTFNATNVAVGDGASITCYDAQKQDALLEKLEALLSSIQNSSLPAPVRTEAMAQAETVKAQVKAATPDKSLMTKSLALIEKAAPAIAGVVSALTAIKTLAGL